ncbi:carbohydrate sulfotransferase 11-like isoform X2 [Neocloeon triangulifer]|nr:carbohydrate sulfotransferase 11-like isoform X2 [Neocloeon triangulifer]
MACLTALANMRTPRVLRMLILFFVCLFLLILYRNISTPAKQHNSPQEDFSSLSSDQLNGLVREAEADMDRRRALVERVCAKHNLGLFRNSAKPPDFKHPPTPQYSVFYIDKPHKMSYCPVYKAASTTWLHQMLILAGKTEEQIKNSQRQLSDQAREIYPIQDSDQVEEALTTMLKLLIVRHPFERLLSAYRDKLENKNVGLEHGVQHFYTSYGKKIVQKYRNGTSDRLEPTFREFVAYLIKEDAIRFDDHWIPYYLFCTPCLVRYDVIAHVETLFRDQIYTIRLAELEGKLSPLWSHLTKGHRSAGETAKRYFKQLSKWHVQRLFEKYRLDFELFGYDHEEYVNYAASA